MDAYITDELPGLVAQHADVDWGRLGITGHSMGGHGALTLAMKNPGKFRSLSAFAPISALSALPWGRSRSRPIAAVIRQATAFMMRRR